MVLNHCLNHCTAIFVLCNISCVFMTCENNSGEWHCWGWFDSTFIHNKACMYMKLMKYSNIVYALMIDSYTLNSSCVCTVCILLSRTSYSLKGCQRATEKGTLQEVEMEFGIDYESEFTPTSSAASQVNTIIDDSKPPSHLEELFHHCSNLAGKSGGKALSDLIEKNSSIIGKCWIDQYVGQCTF